ncbi:phage tail tape measure protein [Microbacterium maritypicum]
MLDAARATKTVGTETEKLAQKKQAFEQLGRGLVVSGAALTAVTALSIKAAMGWESAWAGVTKTVEGTPQQLQQVEDGLRGLTSVLPASHDEIAAVAEAAGQLGIQTDNVVAFTRTMIDMGETTNLSANDAATSLARFMNIMGTAQGDVDNLGSAIVGLGNNYATTEAEIMDMAMRLAGAGKQVGLTEGQVLGLSTALSSVGIEAEAGGSAMSKVMIDIASSVDQGGSRLELFAKTAGVSAETFAEKWKSDPAAALSLFVKGLANAESQGSSTLGVLAELGITEVRMRDALLRSASAADIFSGAMSDGNTAFEENNALTLEAAKRYETVESKLAIAGNSIRDAAIDFGQVFLPAVAGAAEGVTEFARYMGDLPDPVQGVLGILSSAVGVFALAGGTALLAVPKIVEFKLAMQNLGISMRTIGLVGGGAILALTALVTIVGSVAAAQAEARAKAEAYADTLAEGTNKVTRATREMTVANLSARDSVLWWENQSAYDEAEKLGIGFDLVTEAAMGDADALRELRKQLESGAAAHRSSQTEAENYAAWTRQLTEAVAGESASLDEAIKIADQKTRATEASGDASKTAAEAYMTEADAVGDLSGQLSQLIDKINEANGVGQDAVTTNAQYQSALAGLAEQVEKNGASLDQATEAGSANAASLADVARRAQDAAAAQFEQDKATMSSKDAADKYYATLQNQRQAFIDSAAAAGFNKDEVIKLADQVFKLPSETEIKVIAETDTAEDKLRRLKERLDAIPNNSYKRVTLESFSVGKFDVTPNAAGGYYERGVKAFAGGGFEPGIYPYTPGGIHKIAEEYAEGYVSMDPARRVKSEGVWQTIGDRMGFTQSSSQSAAPTQIEVVVSPKGGIDLLQYVDVRVQERGRDVASTLKHRRRDDA